MGEVARRTVLIIWAEAECEVPVGPALESGKLTILQAATRTSGRTNGWIRWLRSTGGVWSQRKRRKEMVGLGDH
jgi:hypothetical protein